MLTGFRVAITACVIGPMLFAASADAAVDFTTNSVPVSGQVLDVAVGDVDGTNGPDIVASVNDGGTGKLAVRLNTGNGSFAAETLSPLGCLASQVELTDLGGTNGDNVPDGAVDGVIACYTQNGLQIGRIAGNGTGAFLGPATLPPQLVGGVEDGLGAENGFQRMTLAHIRPAGSPVVPVWTFYYNATYPGYYYNSALCFSYDWQTRDCPGPADDPPQPNTYPPLTTGVVADARIFATGTREGGVAGEAANGRRARQLTAWGDFPGAGAPAGTSVNGTTRDFGPSPGAQTPAWQSIAIGDLAGDGPDIITAEGVCGCIGSPVAPAAGRVSVLPGTTAEGVVPGVVPVTTPSAPGVLSIEVGDIDLDGRQDVIGNTHTDSGNTVFVQTGDGTGGLGAPVTINLPPSSTYSRAPIILADVDRNGSSDAVVISDGIQVLTNRSTPIVPPNPNPLKPFAGITGLKGSAAVDKRGTLNLGTATNPPTAAVDLSITIPGKQKRGVADSLRAKTTLLGKAKITVPAGGEAALKVRLKSKAKKKLKSGSLKATLTLVATATDGTKETKTQKLKIKPPKKKK